MTMKTSSRNRHHASRRALSALAFVLSVALPAIATAQDTDRVKSYEEAITRADQAWEAQDFATARIAYEQAYLIHPDPTLLFNIASSYRREGNLEKALDYYENYLRAAPADDQFRPQAVETAARLRAELGQRRQAPPKRTSSPLIVHQSPAVDETGLHKLQWAGIATGAGGVLILGYAMIEGSRASSRQSDLEQLSPGQQWTPELQTKYDQGKAAERRAIFAAIAGTGALVTGSVLFFLGHQQAQAERQHNRLTVVPVTDGTMAGALLSGEF